MKQKGVNNVLINSDLSSEEQDEVRSLLREYREIFSDVPKVTNLIEHKVELTQREPVRYKAYPTPHKMQEIVDKEIDDLLEMGVIERSEAPYASPLVLVKKPDNTYRVRVNFKQLNNRFYSEPQCSHCKRCISYSNTDCPSVCPSHAGIVSKRRHVARCSLRCWIAKCV